MKLSIITINLNNSQGLLDTFASIYGNSNDSSISFINSETRIDKWISEKDKGVYDAMNKGINLADGEYLLFLNSGDCLYNNQTLENVFKSLTNSDLIYGNLVFKSSHSEVTYKYPDKLSVDFLFELSLGHPATFIKKKLFEKFGLYDSSYKITADWCFFLICILKGNSSTKFIDETISIFDTNGISSDPSNKEQIFKERHDFLSKEFPLFYSKYLKDKEIISNLYEKEKCLEKTLSSKLYKFFNKTIFKT